MKALLIAEKPSLMRDIQSVYNKMSHPDQIDFIAFAGHVMALKEPDEYKPEWGKPWRKEVLPMIPEPFQFKTIKSSYDLYKNAKSKIDNNHYDFIINACDAGREGELIFYAFYKTIGCKVPVKRFWASDTTEKTLQKAMDNLLDDKEPSLTRLKASAQYRGYFDWLMGMNLSRAINVPVGRVMTPTLNIVVRRELEIQNFEPKDYWLLEGSFGSYKGIWFNKENGDNKILSEEQAKQLKDRLSKSGTVESVDRERKNNYAPTLHSLTELQKEANKVFGYSANDTLKIAQSLYERKKLLTYPRTESRFLPKNMAEKLPSHLKAVQGIDEVKPYVTKILADSQKMYEIMNSKKYVDDKKVTDHHAILPTETKPNISSLSKDELNIYMLVVRRLLSIFMDAYVVDKTTIITNVDHEFFKTTGTTVVQLGYMELYKNFKKRTADTQQEIILPPLKKGQAVQATSYKLLTKQTKPPQRYDDASLLGAMANPGDEIDDEELKNILKEKSGLGTPATRADTIEKLIKKNMIGRKGKSLFATDYGISIIKTLDGKDIISPEMTAVWERKLSQIEDGTYKHKDFYFEMIDYTKVTTEDLINLKSQVSNGVNSQSAETVGTCPKCKGSVLEGKNYFRCQNYKSTCEVLIPKVFGGAKITKTEVKKLLTGKETKEYSFMWKSGKSGNGKLILDSNGKLDFAKGGKGGASPSSSSTKNSVGKCPICEKPVKETQKFYLCEDYKNPCTFLVAKEIEGATISTEDLGSLLEGKETEVKSFIFKSGKSGNAKLKWNKEKNKLDFLFN